MAKSACKDYKMQHTKFRTQADLFPGKSPRRVKIDTEKLRVCEVGPKSGKTDCDTAYRQIRAFGEMKWACDSCISKLCNRSSDNIDRNQRAVKAWM